MIRQTEWGISSTFCVARYSPGVPLVTGSGAEVSTIQIELLALKRQKSKATTMPPPPLPSLSPLFPLLSSSFLSFSSPHLSSALLSAPLLSPPLRSFPPFLSSRLPLLLLFLSSSFSPLVSFPFLSSLSNLLSSPFFSPVPSFSLLASPVLSSPVLSSALLFSSPLP